MSHLTDCERETTWGEAIPARLMFYQQNMALLPSYVPALRLPPWRKAYQGVERGKALAALIAYLRAAQPDVVGLCEVFMNGDRRRIRRALGAVYPYAVDTPDRLGLKQDGGLLLLSTHPVLQSHRMTYASCVGDDCWARKGAIHARIQVPGQTRYDLFLTHLQSGRGEGTRARREQLDELGEFVAAHRDLRRPAALLGDLNVNGLEPDAHDDLMARLSAPVDLWLAAGDGGSGITCDNLNSFGEAAAPRAARDPARHRDGERLDYVLGWPGSRLRPTYRSARVVVLQSSVGQDGRGRDISDHYGLWVEQSHLRRSAADARGPTSSADLFPTGSVRPCGAE